MSIIHKTITFVFDDLKPVSTNNYKTPIKRGNYVSMTKTAAAKKMTSEINSLILCRKPDIFDFEANYSVFEHYLRCEIIIETPDLMTQKGKISSRSLDIDNCSKVLIDSVFGNFEKLDDKMICALNLKKIKGARHRISLLLERRDLSILGLGKHLAD